MSILKLEDVGYRYKDADEDDFVLRNVNYEFDKGKIYAIKGKSGSGKTTLLSLISGLEKCSNGNIIFKDINLANYDYVYTKVLYHDIYNFNYITKLVLS